MCIRRTIRPKAVSLSNPDSSEGFQTLFYSLNLINVIQESRLNVKKHTMPYNFNCIFPGCNASTRSTDAVMFGFPSSAGRCAQWCNILGLPDGYNTKYAKVCINHFKPTDIKWTPRLVDDAKPRSTLAPAAIEPEREPLAPVDENNQLVPVGLVEEYRDQQQRLMMDKRQELKSARQDLAGMKRKLAKTETKLSSVPLTAELIQEYFGDSRGLCNLIVMQFHRHGKGAGTNYTTVEKALAFTIFYSSGKNGYRTLINLGLHLPALGTLKNWISRLKFTPGNCPQMLDTLKDQMSRMNEYERDCVLVFDETRVKKQVTYNRHTDSLEGVAKKERQELQMRYSDEALVFMLRGLNTNFKFPLSFQFSAGGFAAHELVGLLTNSLRESFKSGANVVAVIADQASTNSKAFKSLGITVGHNSFIFCCDKEIFVFYDPPHLMKNIRNNLMDNGLRIPYGDDFEEIEWKHLRQFFDLDLSLATRLCPKLTLLHLEAKHQDRMKVRLATQVLSSTVASGVETAVKSNMFPKEDNCKMLALASFCRNFDFIFDYMNIGVQVDHHKAHKSGKYLASRFEHILSLADWVKGITKRKDKNGKIGRGRIQCLDGVEMNLRGLVVFVSQKLGAGYGYVLSRRLQSDCIEHFFSMLKIVKGSGFNPTCQQFRWAFRYLFMTFMIKGPLGANCDQDFETDECLDKVVKKIDFILNYKPVEQDVVEESDEYDEFESSCDDTNDEDRTSYAVNKFFSFIVEKESSEASANAANFLGNRAVKVIVKKLKCLECKDMLELLEDRPSNRVYPEEYFHSQKSLSSFHEANELGYGHLLKQSTRNMFTEIDNNFSKLTFEAFNMEGTNVVRNIIRVLLRIPEVKTWQENCSLECRQHRKLILSQFVRTRMYVLVKEKNDELNIKTTTYTPSAPEEVECEYFEFVE